MRTTLLLISFLLITTELLAQGLVRGRVIDGETGEPMFSSSVVSIEREDNLFDPFFRRYLNEILLRNVIKKFFSLNLRKL